jgi:hypothetical protein
MKTIEKLKYSKFGQAVDPLFIITNKINEIVDHLNNSNAQDAPVGNLTKENIADIMSIALQHKNEIDELQLKLDAANAKIKELEQYAKDSYMRGVDHRDKAYKEAQQASQGLDGSNTRSCCMDDPRNYGQPIACACWKITERHQAAAWQGLNAGAKIGGLK